MQNAVYIFEMIALTWKDKFDLAELWNFFCKVESDVDTCKR
jgi:hypothetical protein